MKRTDKGTRITLVLLIVLLALALPMTHTASPVAAKNQARTVTRSFSNPAPINLPTASNADRVSADLYPSAITVGGLKGKIRDVNLILNDFSHTFEESVDVLLVGPRGQTAIVMAQVGEEAGVNGVTLRLDDEAAASLPGAAAPQSGDFRPANFANSPVVFNTPAPPVTSANAALSVFDGTDPNGKWRLYVQDQDGPSNFGAFAGGWELEITTIAKPRKKR